MSLQIGYLKLEEIFKSQRKLSLIIHYQPHNDVGEVRTESVLFTLFMFVVGLMSYLRYLCL